MVINTQNSSIPSYFTAFHYYICSGGYSQLFYLYGGNIVQ